MYGIVNQAIQGLVTENFGEDNWFKIKEMAGVEVDYFLSDQPYDDEITFDLVASASEILNLPATAILEAFGKYWVLKTGMEKYGSLMKAGGKSFTEFLHNLPHFHSRIMLIYPKLSPPEFSVEDFNEDIILLHYYSSRDGLTHFVIGLIHGIAEMFGTSCVIELKSSEKLDVWHDVFIIRHRL
jgi:hypothetical protein